jgi:hypothetical protein
MIKKLADETGIAQKYVKELVGATVALVGQSSWPAAPGLAP